MARARITAPAAAVIMVVVLMVILALAQNTAAQSPMLAPEMAPGPSMAAPGPSMDCFSVLLNMSDCLTFVEIGSNLTKPDAPCCPELAGLVESNPVCLCQLLGDPDKAGITVDIPKALKLPSACGITTPPVSVCAAIGIPVSVPTASPAGSPEGASAARPVGGKDGSGGGQSIEASFTMCFLSGLATIIFITFS